VAKYNIADYIGRKFGRWTIIADAGMKRSKTGRPEYYAKVQCECSLQTIKDVVFYNIFVGKSKSCGCFSSEVASENFKKINLSKGRELHDQTEKHSHMCWLAMKLRCYSPENNRYYLYGAKGITVCDRWRTSFRAFLTDMGHPPSDYHTVDRINGELSYYPENCRWALPVVQSNNRSTCVIVEHEGRTQTMMEWAKELNLNYASLRHLYITKKVPFDSAIIIATKPFVARIRSNRIGYLDYIEAY